MPPIIDKRTSINQLTDIDKSIAKFVREFQDFVTCRGETAKKLQSRHNLLPIDMHMQNAYKIFIGYKAYYFDLKDILRVLDKWRGPGKIGADIKNDYIHFYTCSLRDI